MAVTLPPIFLPDTSGTVHNPVKSRRNRRDCPTAFDDVLCCPNGWLVLRLKAGSFAGWTADPCCGVGQAGCPATLADNAMACASPGSPVPGPRRN